VFSRLSLDITLIGKSLCLYMGSIMPYSFKREKSVGDWDLQTLAPGEVGKTLTYQEQDIIVSVYHCV